MSAKADSPDPSPDQPPERIDLPPLTLGRKMRHYKWTVVYAGTKQGADGKPVVEGQEGMTQSPGITAAMAGVLAGVASEPRRVVMVQIAEVEPSVIHPANGTLPPFPPRR